MGKPSEKTWKIPPVDIDLPAELKPPESLYQTAEIHRPLLSKGENQINAANSRLALSKKGILPDFKLGAFYGFRDNDKISPGGTPRSDLLTLKLAVDLPVFAHKKQAREVDQRKSEVVKSTHSLQDLKARVSAEISTAHSDYHHAQKKCSYSRPESFHKQGRLLHQ